MKRFVMFLVVICMLFSAYAVVEGDGMITITNSNDLIGSKVKLPIEYNNTASSVIIGFSNTAVGENDYSDKTSIKQKSATLSADVGAYTASYGLTSPFLYIFWQIVSDTQIDLSISALASDSNLNGAMTSGDKKMNWYVYASEDDTELLDTSVSATGEEIDTGHDPSNAIGKTGSKQIYIKTHNLTTVPAGNYSGTLVVTIIAGV